MGRVEARGEVSMCVLFFFEVCLHLKMRDAQPRLLLSVSVMCVGEDVWETGAPTTPCSLIC